VDNIGIRRLLLTREITHRDLTPDFFGRTSMNGLKKKNKLPVYSLALFGRYGIGKSLKFLQTLTCENGPSKRKGHY
jgi:hypothetical protein